MKKKFLYIAAIIICLCMFTTASKECGKITDGDCSGKTDAKNKGIETTSAEMEDGEWEFPILRILF